MDSYRRDNRSGGRRDFQRRDYRDRSDRPDMHKTTCSNCGKSCEVPFKPTGAKPVYCSDCFEKMGNGSGRGNDRNERRDFGRSNYSDRPMYDAVCAKCGNSCKIPFQPRNDKPVYCSDCFRDKNGKSDSRPAENYNKQFVELNAKLDKLLSILEPLVAPKVEPVTPTVKETTAPKIVKPLKKSNKKK